MYPEKTPFPVYCRSCWYSDGWDSLQYGRSYDFTKPFFSQFQSLQQLFPEMVSFKHTSAEVKLAAAWLIEQCGWKGKRFGDAGVHEKHALVLANYGSAKGKEIYMLSEKIKRSVEDKFGVALEREVNVV